MAKTKEPPAGSVTNFEQPVPGDPDFAKIHYTDKSGKEVFGNYRRSELLNEIKTMDGMVYGGDEEDVGAANQRIADHVAVDRMLVAAWPDETPGPQTNQSKRKGARLSATKREKAPA